MRKVKIAYLHTGLSIPGISNEIGTTLNPTDPQSKIKGAQLFWETGDGLNVLIKGFEVFLPAPAVKSLVFYPEEKIQAPLLA